MLTAAPLLVLEEPAPPTESIEIGWDNIDGDSQGSGQLCPSGVVSAPGDSSGWEPGGSGDEAACPIEWPQDDSLSFEGPGTLSGGGGQSTPVGRARAEAQPGLLGGADGIDLDAVPVSPLATAHEGPDAVTTADDQQYFAPKTKLRRAEWRVGSDSVHESLSWLAVAGPEDLETGRVVRVPADKPVPRPSLLSAIPSSLRPGSLPGPGGLQAAGRMGRPMVSASRHLDSLSMVFAATDSWLDAAGKSVPLTGTVASYSPENDGGNSESGEGRLFLELQSSLAFADDSALRLWLGHSGLKADSASTPRPFPVPESNPRIVTRLPIPGLGE